MHIPQAIPVRDFTGTDRCPRYTPNRKTPRRRRRFIRGTDARARRGSTKNADAGFVVESFPVARWQNKWRSCFRKWICCSLPLCATKSSPLPTTPDIAAVARGVRGSCRGTQRLGPRPATSAAKLSPPRRVPRGVTLIGRPLEEGTMAQAGLALERAFAVASQRPAGF